MNADLDSLVIILPTYVCQNVQPPLIITEILILADVLFSALRVAMLRIIQDNARHNALQINMLTILQGDVWLFVHKVKLHSPMISQMIVLGYVLQTFMQITQRKHVYQIVPSSILVAFKPMLIILVDIV